MNDNVKLALYRYRYAIILLAVVLGLTLATPKFFSSNNFLNILWAVSIVGIISMGATFVILVGRIDLSVGQTAALSGITAALLIKGGTPIPAAIAAASESAASFLSFIIYILLPYLRSLPQVLTILCVTLRLELFPGTFSVTVSVTFPITLVSL